MLSQNAFNTLVYCQTVLRHHHHQQCGAWADLQRSSEQLQETWVLGCAPQMQAVSRLRQATGNFMKLFSMVSFKHHLNASDYLERLRDVLKLRGQGERLFLLELEPLYSLSIFFWQTIHDKKKISGSDLSLWRQPLRLLPRQIPSTPETPGMAGL